MLKKISKNLIPVQEITGLEQLNKSQEMRKTKSSLRKKRLSQTKLLRINNLERKSLEVGARS